MKKNYLAALIVIIVLVGCTRDYQEKQEQQDVTRIRYNSDIGQRTTLAELGYDSYGAMLDDGWEIIHKTEKYEPEKYQARVINNRQNRSRIKQKLTEQHIKDLGFSENDLTYLYSRVFNIKPDGVTINDYRTPCAPRNLLSNKYGWYAYIETGPIITITGQNSNEDKNSSTTLCIYNESDEELPFEIHLGYYEGQELTWNVSSTSEIKISGEIGIPINIEGNETILDVVLGGKGQTKVKLKTDICKIILPPHSKRQIVTKQEITKSRKKYKIPLIATGLVALNFHSKVDGHYHWASNAGLLFNNKIKSEIVTVDIEKKSGIDVFISRATPF